MDGLRWLLLLFGSLLVVGIYWYSQRERKLRKSESPTRSAINIRREPSLNGDDQVSGSGTAGELTEELHGDSEVNFEDDSDDSDQDENLDEKHAQVQKIVTLRIVAKGHTAFVGDELALSLRGAGLRHGKFGIFHRYAGEDEKKIVFSAASLVEPGSFDLTNLKSQEIPGISLFMVLPGPMDGPQAFDLMMACARGLSQTLNADLLDETGSTLSIQRERFLREEIIQYQTVSLIS